MIRFACIFRKQNRRNGNKAYRENLPLPQMDIFYILMVNELVY